MPRRLWLIFERGGNKVSVIELRETLLRFSAYLIFSFLEVRIETELRPDSQLIKRNLNVFRRMTGD